MYAANVDPVELHAVPGEVRGAGVDHAPRVGGGLLAVDVGGTRIKAALWGNQEASHTVRRTDRTPHGLVGQLAQLHAAYGSPERWALCLPGMVRDGIWSAHQPFPTGRVPIAEMLAEWGLPAPFCCRDCEAAVAGEADGRSIVLIQLGTGIGCGVTVDGAMLSDGSGDPVGLWMAHLPVLVDGAPCARCGGRGCASTHASMRGITDQLGHEVSADELRERAQAGEEPFARVYERALEAIARLAQMAAMNFRPEDVRLAGGSARAWSEELIPRVRHALAALPEAAVGHTQATLSVGGELAALRGLVALAQRADPAVRRCTIPMPTPSERGWESRARNSKNARRTYADKVLDEVLPGRGGRELACAGNNRSRRASRLTV
jgi:predicted NBD/HSP70 family sugar kinase